MHRGNIQSGLEIIWFDRGDQDRGDLVRKEKQRAGCLRRLEEGKKRLMSNKGKGGH